MVEIIDVLKRYTDRKQNTEKVEISVLQLNRVIKTLEQDTVPFDFELYVAGLMDMPKEMIKVIDKIRTEIMDTGAYEQEVHGKTEFLKGINYCLSVIDKYKDGKEK